MKQIRRNLGHPNLRPPNPWTIEVRNAIDPSYRFRHLPMDRILRHHWFILGAVRVQVQLRTGGGER